MKKAFLAIFGLIWFLTGYSQINQGEDGLYYGKDEKLFSGDYREYWDNGQVKQQMLINDGKMDGQVTLWFRSGTIREIRMYSSGLRNGVWTSYDEFGTKTGEAGYQDDLKDGPWKIWDEKGVLRYDMLYTKGQKAGLWVMYDESGKKISEKKFPDGK
jgi:antitoxin component YwqK of YwqJK toxin-antitoxin module